MNASFHHCIVLASVLFTCLPDLLFDIAPAPGSSSHSREVLPKSGFEFRGASLLQTSSYSGISKVDLDAETLVGRSGSWTNSAVVFALVALLLLLGMFVAIMLCFRHEISEQSKENYERARVQPHPNAASDTYNTPRDSIDGGHESDAESDAGDYDLSEYFHQGEHKHAERSVYDEEAVVKTVKKKFGSWKLLQQLVGALAQFWAALVFMYWSLLHNSGDLMQCKDHPNHHTHDVVVRHLCNYTYACLRGFPILAANMVLVLMIRILVQNRIYYSFLEINLVVDFADTPVMHTYWPWLTGLSMVNGGLHFPLKMYYDPSEDEGVTIYTTYMSISRKFVLPGFIFFSFLLRYADIENTLIPLNRIVEEDYTKRNRYCPWLSKVQVVNERVLAYAVRHNDIVGHAQAAAGGHAPSIGNLIQNLADNYEKYHKEWQKRKHRGWGLFRSMWPAAVLVDNRLDREDADTRAWLTVFVIVLVGCSFISVYSLFSLFRSGSKAFASGIVIKEHRETIGVDTEALLIDVVLVWHAIFIVVFLYHTVRNMFYRAIMEPETTAEEGVRVERRRRASEVYI